MTGAAAVSILDLGLGNLRSVARAFERAGAQVSIVRGAEAVRSADRLVVPGQGAFRDCADAMRDGVGDAIGEAIALGRPYMGICLGMQLLFEGSEEAPDRPGLALYAGRARRFSGSLVDRSTGDALKVPHMGWNQIRGNHGLLPESGWFYFVHSYYCDPADPDLVVATADYGGPFCAAVARDNVFACQFPPEKSQHEGHLILERFLES